MAGQALVRITDIDDLARWLASRPRDDAVLIAARGALRLLPLTVGALGDTSRAGRAMVILPMVRALAAAVFAGTWRKVPPGMPAVRSGVARAATAVAAATARAATDSAIAEDAARSAAADEAAETDAARAAARARAYVAAGGAIDAIYAAVRATTATDPTGEVTEIGQAAGDSAGAILVEMARDAAALEADGGFPPLAGHPLWRGAPPGWAPENWARLRRRLEEDPEERWQVWIAWVEDRLAGHSPNPELEHAIALLPEDDWRAGPAQVNARIAALMARHPGRPALGAPPSDPLTIEGRVGDIAGLPGRTDPRR